MKEKRKEPRRYDREFKMNAVKLYREEGVAINLLLSFFAKVEIPQCN